MPVSRGLPMLRQAIKKQEEDKLFFRWAAMYQSEMSFDEFKKCLEPKKARTKEECLGIAKGILDGM